MKFSVKVQPRASRDEVKQCPGSDYKVYLKAAPVDGKANEALVRVIAGYFKARRSDVRIVSGFNSRKKVIEINI
ncbi:MAG: DUF167 domain-containing protein [Candidatus Omnitrophica bacterium]|nr:DUF167 domain-containing protein [Candidatus Omnitrophota bacterium]